MQAGIFVCFVHVSQCLPYYIVAAQQIFVKYSQKSMCAIGSEPKAKIQDSYSNLGEGDSNG